MAPKSSPRPSSEQAPPVRVIPLSRDWVALVHADGRVTLQFVSQVVVSGTGEVLDLAALHQASMPIQRHIDSLEEGRLWVRTLDLQPDGSVAIDLHGVSEEGVLGPECYAVLGPFLASAARYAASLPGRQAGDPF